MNNYIDNNPDISIKSIATSKAGLEYQETGAALKQVLGLECFSWACSRGGLPAKQVPEFLCLLTRLLLDGPKDIIEWRDGKIIIYNPLMMESDVLKRYFRHSNLKSFKRQLNNFGFRMLSRSKPDSGQIAYVHSDVGPNVTTLLTIKVIMIRLRFFFSMMNNLLGTIFVTELFFFLLLAA